MHTSYRCDVIRGQARVQQGPEVLVEAVPVDQGEADAQELAIAELEGLGLWEWLLLLHRPQ